MSLRDDILRYSESSSEEEQLLKKMAALVAQWGVPEIVVQLESFLRTGTSAEKCEALAFLRDVSITRSQYPDFDDIIRSFRGQICKASIFSIMGQNLYSSEVSVRRDTIYTFGKMFFKQNISILSQAVSVYMEQYPEDIDALLFELFWLQEKKDFGLLNRLVETENPHVRTAVKKYLETIGALDSSEDAENLFRLRELLQ